MMKSRWWLLAAVLILFYACSKPTGVGTEIIPGEDLLNTDFTDTLTIETYTERDDTIITSRLDRNILGSMDDPVFGKSYAGIFAQVRLPANDISFGDTAIIDSIVLTLRYAPTPLYGDENAAHSVKVYRLSESMDVDETYYNYSNFTYDATPIGEKLNFVPDTKTSPIINGDTLPAHLRIRLDDALGQEILDEGGTTNLSTNDEFLKYFKGIYIAPDTSSGFSNSMMYIDMRSTLSTVWIYYSNTTDDSIARAFPITTASAIVNQFHHNYSGAPVADQLNSGGEDSIGYIQGMAGVRVRVKIPHIASFGNITVNKAELIITEVNPTGNDPYAAPEYIIPRVINSGTGALEAVLDQLISEITPGYSLDGKKQTVMINGEEHARYKLNLAGYLNLLARNEIEDTEFVIKVYPAANTAARLPIGGGNYSDPNIKMKIRLYYTKL